MAASRSRRGPSKRQLARDAEFESLRKVLRSDEVRSEQYKLDDDGDVYELVDEARYHEIVKERRGGPVRFHVISLAMFSFCQFLGACSHALYYLCYLYILLIGA